MTEQETDVLRRMSTIYGGSHSIDVLIGGRPIKKYHHEGNTFIEGRKGSKYVLRFTNGSGRRVLFVPLVDGLCTLDGKTATDSSAGYVIQAHSTIDIPGFTVDSQNAAEFVFGERESAYATEMGQPSAVGTIAGIVYSEKTVLPPYPWGPIQTWPAGYQPWYGSSVASRTVPKGFYSTDISRGAALCRSMGTETLSVSASCSSSDASTLSMGTEWGKETGFSTVQTTFERGDVVSRICLYYDSRKGLAARGIPDFQPRPNPLPDPFGSIGCPKPAGWTGK